MLQVIDQGYLRGILELPDGLERMERWVHQLIEERDTAERVASAAVKGVTASRTFPGPGVQLQLDDLRTYLAEQIQHIETRIEDGKGDLGATVWRIALEDVVREHRAELARGAP